MSTLPDTISELIQFDTTTLSVTTREGKHREFKRDFTANDFSECTKLLAAFSNADGGILVFGVSEKPRLIIGVKQIVDEAQWATTSRRSRSRDCREYEGLHKNRSKQVTDKDGKTKDVEVLREGAFISAMPVKRV